MTVYQRLRAELWDNAKGLQYSIDTEQPEIVIWFWIGMVQAMLSALRLDDEVWYTTELTE